MILVIDTSSIEFIYLALGREGKVIAEERIVAKFSQEEKLIVALRDFLLKNKQKVEDLEGIIAVKGPGSFSALRIGLSVVNSLAWSLNIKNVGLSKDEFVDYKDLLKKGEERLAQLQGWQNILPEYGKEPNISSSNKK